MSIRLRSVTKLWSRTLCTKATSDADIKLIAKWKIHYREPLNELVKTVLEDKSYRSVVNSKYIDFMNWTLFANSFRRSLIKDPQMHLNSDGLSQLMNHIDAYARNIEEHDGQGSKQVKGCLDHIFDMMLNTALLEMKDTIQTNEALSSNFDSRLPHEWYPYARIMKRKIIYHGGPTNSGKTYQAIQRLKQANPENGGGLYCGPLRLLALEIFELLNRQGTSTDLLTGQEKRFVPGSSHISCTIEMLSMTRQYDVAVIDEIQMIADPERGHAWTRALLGLQAREIHVCGGKEAYEIVKSLCATTGDDFEFCGYDRLSTLVVEESSLRGDYSRVQPGDCVVAFSVADIFSIRKEIEEKTNYKCAVIYGKLPPETRSTQARLFNDENSGYDILVASDAIGMGLNLNIGRIIFHTIFKRSQNITDASSLYMPPSHVKQIAGRAGRKSSKYAIGKVTAWQERDLAYVRAVMQWDIPQIMAAGLFPPTEQIQSFHDQILMKHEQIIPSANEKVAAAAEEIDNAITAAAATTQSKQTLQQQILQDDSDELNEPNHQTLHPKDIPLAKIIERFVELSQVDQRYFMCKYDSIVIVCNWLHTVPLTIPDRLTFANAPVNFNDNLTMHQLYSYAATYSVGRPVFVGIRIPKASPSDVQEFADLCAKHNIIDLYLWLSLRFPKLFIERDRALVLKATVVTMIERSLSLFTLTSKVSFHKSYLGTLRQLNRRITKREPIALPPLMYGEELRQETKRNLQRIHEDLWHIDTDSKHHKEEEEDY